MELFDSLLLFILKSFSQKKISTNELREYLAIKFFDEIPTRNLDYILLSEIEGFLSEYERGDRSLASVRQKASELSQAAIVIRENVLSFTNQGNVQTHDFSMTLV